MVHGKSSFLTRQVLETSHLLVGVDSVAELTVHEVVFCYTEPCLGNKAVIREVTDQAFTEAEGLLVFATGFLHGSSLIQHHGSLAFLGILVDVFQEIAQRLLVVCLGELVDVCALGGLVVAVSAPCHIFFVLGLLIQEELFF